MAIEDAPISGHLYSFDRGPIGFEIATGFDDISVERTGALAPEQRERIDPGRKFAWHLLQADKIDSTRHLAQLNHQRLVYCSRLGHVERYTRPQNRRVVIGHVQVGKLDDAYPVTHAPDQRHKRNFLSRSGVAYDRNQRGRFAEGAVLQRMLESCFLTLTRPARSGQLPVFDKIDLELRRVKRRRTSDHLLGFHDRRHRPSTSLSRSPCQTLDNKTVPYRSGGLAYFCCSSPPTVASSRSDLSVIPM
jgi:hypothetical protein